MEAILLKNVARKYELGTHHVVIRFGGEEIDLRKISLVKANELHKTGKFPYLKLKVKK